MSLGDIVKSVAAPVASALTGPAGGAIIGGLLGAAGSGGSSGSTQQMNSTTTGSRDTNTTGSTSSAANSTANTNTNTTGTSNTTGTIIGSQTGTGTTASVGQTAGTTTTQLAQQQQIGQLLQMLNGISGIDPSSLVPGLNTTQLQGQQSIINAANAGTGEAANNSLLTLLNPNLLNAATNPNLQGAMDAATTTVFNQLQKNVLPELTNGAVAAGQVGGSRQGVLENRAVQDATAEALRQTLGLANQNYQTGLGTMLSAITAAPAALQTNLAGGQAILDVGNQLQGQQAAEAAAPITLAQAFQQLLNGNYGQTVTTQGTQQQVGTTAQQQASTQQSAQQTSQQTNTQQASTANTTQQQTSQQQTSEDSTSTTKSTQKGTTQGPSLLSGAIGGAVTGAALQAELFPGSMKTGTSGDTGSSGSSTPGKVSTPKQTQV